MKMTSFTKNISDKARLINEKLDQIEAEMKRIEYWNPNPPALKNTDFLAAPSFELWLQSVFIPNARKAVKDEQYIDKSEVGLMAMRQYDYHSYVPEAQNLLKLLFEFDKIMES